MRYGIFSDIHSNLEALEAVIKAYRKEKIDKYFCLGDVVGYGAEPNECVQAVRALAGVTVAGNHDWGAIGLFSTELFNDDARAAAIWTAAQLSAESGAFLRGLGLVHETGEMVLVHGSLNEPRDFNYLFKPDDCRPTFELMNAPVCFIGHTHAPAVFIMEKGGGARLSDRFRFEAGPKNKYIVNVGSVGQPRDGIPDAAYCIFDTEKSEIQIKRAAYDVYSARQKIIDKGLPAFLANRLLTGN
jgi:predicted phosphodiesterase